MSIYRPAIKSARDIAEAAATETAQHIQQLLPVEARLTWAAFQAAVASGVKTAELEGGVELAADHRSEPGKGVIEGG